MDELLLTKLFLNQIKKIKGGFTQLDWLIMSIIVTIILIIALHNLLENPESRRIRQLGERNLRLFTSGNSLNAVKCVGVDEDQDGWVECQATTRQGQSLALQCGYDGRHEQCKDKEN